MDKDGLLHTSFKPSALSIQNVNIGVIEGVTLFLKMQMYSWVLFQWDGSPVLCHVSVEGLFGFTYVEVRAFPFLCALNGIHNITDLVSKYLGFPHWASELKKPFRWEAKRLQTRLEVQLLPTKLWNTYSHLLSISPLIIYEWSNWSFSSFVSDLVLSTSLIHAAKKFPFC